jgi:hypothetical protein
MFLSRNLPPLIASHSVNDFNKMPIDYTRYPSDWKQIRSRILERANNKCEDCELPNHSKVFAIKLKVQDSDGRYKYKMYWIRDPLDAAKAVRHGLFVKEVKVVLTIAHLDHDETNHNVDDERLKALCQHCHLLYDAKEKYRRRVASWVKEKPPVDTGGKL